MAEEIIRATMDHVRLGLQALHYNAFHVDLFIEFAEHFLSEFPTQDAAADFCTQDRPLCTEDAEEFTEERFDNPESIRHRELPQAGAQSFLYFSLLSLSQHHGVTELSFPNLFRTFTDIHLGRAIMRITEEPRYLQLDLPQFTDVHFWAGTLEEHPAYYRFLHPTVRENLELAFLVCERIPALFQYCSPALRNNKTLALPVCERSGLALGHCSDALAVDEDVVRAACTNNEEAARYIGKDLLVDEQRLGRLREHVSMENLSPAARRHDQVLLSCYHAGIFSFAELDEDLQPVVLEALVQCGGAITIDQALTGIFSQDPDLPRVTRNPTPVNHFDLNSRGTTPVE